MKSRPMIALATATAVFLSGVVAGSNPVSTADEINNQASATMADIYQPYFDPDPQLTDSYFEIQSESSLPAYTRFYLLSSSSPITHLHLDDVLIIHSAGNGTLFAQFKRDAQLTPGDREIPLRLGVSYPDGSTEVIETKISLRPYESAIYHPRFESGVNHSNGSGVIKPGQKLVLGLVNSDRFDSSPPSFGLPSGMKLELRESFEIQHRRNVGWSFDINSDTDELIITAPTDTREDFFDVYVNIYYQDGTSDWAGVTAVVEQSNFHKATFAPVEVGGGERISVTSNNEDLPSNVTFRVDWDDPAYRELSAAGWRFDSQSARFLDVQVPVDAEGVYDVPLEAIYPDNGTSSTSIRIIVKKAKDAVRYLLYPYSKSISSGNVDIISPRELGELPKGTVVGLTDGFMAQTLIDEGWSFSQQRNGDLKVRFGADAEGKYQIPVSVEYPDGSSVDVTVELVLEKSRLDGDHDQSLRSGGSSFGSS